MIKKALLVASLAVLGLGTPALAADLALPPPPPMPMMPPMPVIPRVEIGPSQWYLRGDVGVGIEDFSAVDVTLTCTSSCGGASLAGFSRISKDMTDPTIIGGGIGFRWTDNIRFDLTGEYRTESDFNFTIAGPPNPGNQEFHLYPGTHAAVVGLANIYYDLGNFWGVTPFIGGGAGFGYHRINNFVDIGEGSAAGGFGIANPTNSTEFAWAVHAGFDYEVTQNLTLEMSYRYLDEGNIDAGVVVCQNTATCGLADYVLHKVTSQDLRLGMRWALGSPPPPPPPMIPETVVRKY